jgi:magnesium and cobalt transporter
MAKDLLKLQRAPELNLRTLLRPAVFVPESKRLNELLRDFRVQPQPSGDRDRRVRQHRRADHHRGRAGRDRRRDRGRVRRRQGAENGIYTLADGSHRVAGDTDIAP